MVGLSRRFAGAGVVVAGALLALGLAGSPAALAGKPEGVRVLRDGHVVAVFHSARCWKRARAGDFKALTAETDSGYTLFASIDKFTGFHVYDLEQGPNADPYVVVHGPGRVSYSNLHRPPFPSPGFGQIRFKDHHRLMGIGYSPAYSQGGSDAVTFTGVLTCHFPRKTR